MRASSRALAVALAVGAGVTGSVSTTAQTTERPQACESPSRTVRLFAENMSGGRVGYGREPGGAHVPGPLIEMTEGECIAVRLVNRTDRRLSFHPHGVAYTVASDGSPINASCVRAGRSRTYVIDAVGRHTRADGTIHPGTAGYWHYHDHCMGAHGTEGIRSGLFGGLIVRRAGDPVPEKTFVSVMSGVHFNLRRAPRTPIYRANQGQRVEFVVITHGSSFHTFHLHGHRWADNRTGVPDDLSDETPVIDNRTAGPGDSFGFQLIAGEESGPGAWMYHCHVQSHSDSGMSGIFLVRDPDGTVNAQTQRSLDRWREHPDH